MSANRGRLPDGSANPIDKHIGAQIKRRRLMLGLSQQELADQLGLTFQQVQKYEQGANRVNGSRMWDICQVLQIEPNFLFEGLDKDSLDNSPRMLKCSIEIAYGRDDIVLQDPLSRPETLELVTAYYKIDPILRVLFLQVIKCCTIRAH